MNDTPGTAPSSPAIIESSMAAPQRNSSRNALRRPRQLEPSSPDSVTSLREVTRSSDGLQPNCDGFQPKSGFQMLSASHTKEQARGWESLVRRRMALLALWAWCGMARGGSREGSLSGPHTKASHGGSLGLEILCTKRPSNFQDRFQK